MSNGNLTIDVVFLKLLGKPFIIKRLTVKLKFDQGISQSHCTTMLFYELDVVYVELYLGHEPPVNTIIPLKVIIIHMPLTISI